MTKPDLGMKRICVACGAKFYDLAKVPASCPKCGIDQPAEQPRPKRGPVVVEEKIKKRVATAGGDAETDDVEVEDVDADAAADADELEDEDETIDAEIEVEAERDEEG